MEAIFLKLLNMSATAGWLILAVMVLRLFMKQLPRWLSCVLWAIVAVRLICPFSMESSFSLIPSTQILKPYEVSYVEKPAVNSGTPALNHMVNPVFDDVFTPAPSTSENPLYVWISIAGIVWLLGFIVLLGYALISFFSIRRKVQEAVPLKDNIWLCDHVSSSFILGIFRPKIYLSSSIRKEEIDYVLAHENAHLKRWDHWWKPLGYLLLSVYWFHPLIWAAYVLFCQDIEFACDEKVIKDMDLEGKKAYSHALVSCSMNRRRITVCPLAFGEGDVKGRVKRVLNYKKPAFWMIAVAGIACIMAAVCFLTDPAKASLPQTVGEKKNYNGNMILYLDHWYRLEDLSDETIEWLNWFNSLSPEEQLKINSVPWEMQKLLYGNDTEAPVAMETNAGEENLNTDDSPKSESFDGSDTQTIESSLDRAIYAAIMEKNKSVYSDNYDFACCDFVILETTSATLPTENTAHTIICYGWALYQEYQITENGIESSGGSHIPIALTFSLDDDGYTLMEYWKPRDGSYFVSDIQSRFPGHIVEDGINSQKFIIQQIQSCYSQAIQYSGLDSDAVIHRLLSTLCSDVGFSFDPQNNYDRNNTQFRELIYYGEYTLRYCFGRFDQGEENGLQGNIMALICEELLQTRGKLPVNASDADTGQFWYDTLLAHSSNLVVPYLHRN